MGHTRCALVEGLLDVGGQLAAQEFDVVTLGQHVAVVVDDAVERSQRGRQGAGVERVDRKQFAEAPLELVAHCECEGRGVTDRGENRVDGLGDRHEALAQRFRQRSHEGDDRIAPVTGNDAEEARRLDLADCSDR